MATISRKGFGQVEPNHLSGIVTGQIYAQLPVDKETMGSIIENGRFAKYDYATGKVNLTGEGQWMLIYNEEKLYDERKQSHKDFAMIADDFVDGEIVPRLIATVVGDIFTTNAFGAADSDKAEVEGVEVSEGTKVYVGTDGYLALTGDEEGPVFKVVKIYTMPDGQSGVKLQRIA
jgi:hypothetical protein